MNAILSTVLTSMAVVRAFTITCESDPKAISACTDPAISSILSHIKVDETGNTREGACTKWITSGSNTTGASCSLFLCSETDTGLYTYGDTAINAINRLQSNCSTESPAKPKTAGGKYHFEGDVGYLWLVNTNEAT